MIKIVDTIATIDYLEKQIVDNNEKSNHNKYIRKVHYDEILVLREAIDREKGNSRRVDHERIKQLEKTIEDYESSREANWESWYDYKEFLLEKRIRILYFTKYSRVYNLFTSDTNWDTLMYVRQSEFTLMQKGSFTQPPQRGIRNDLLYHYYELLVKYDISEDTLIKLLNLKPIMCYEEINAIQEEIMRISI